MAWHKRDGTRCRKLTAMKERAKTRAFDKAVRKFLGRIMLEEAWDVEKQFRLRPWLLNLQDGSLVTYVDAPKNSAQNETPA